LGWSVALQDGSPADARASRARPVVFVALSIHHLEGLMSRRDFDKRVEQRPPAAFFILIAVIVVAAVLLAIFVVGW
jgi:hypothetical protein